MGKRLGYALAIGACVPWALLLGQVGALILEQVTLMWVIILWFLVAVQIGCLLGLIAYFKRWAA